MLMVPGFLFVIIRRFLSIYTRSLPLDIASRIWDWYLLRGEVYLFQAGLGLLKYFESRFLKEDSDGLMYDLTHLSSLHAKLDEDQYFECVDMCHVSHTRYLDILSKFESSMRDPAVPRPPEGKHKDAGATVDDKVVEAASDLKQISLDDETSTAMGETAANGEKGAPRMADKTDG